jgi:hypothetical protein
MTLKIEKGIPIPRGQAKKGKSDLYDALPQMEPGDSVLVPKPEGKHYSKHMVSVCSLVAYYKSRYTGGKWDFRCKSVEGGVRVWRLS